MHRCMPLSFLWTYIILLILCISYSFTGRIGNDINIKEENILYTNGKIYTSESIDHSELQLQKSHLSINQINLGQNHKLKEMKSGKAEIKYRYDGTYPYVHPGNPTESSPEETALVESGNDKIAEDLVAYVGAVLEYEPFDKMDEEEKGYGVLRYNVRKILQYANQAKNKYGVDILVAPEYGVQSLKMNPDGDFETFITFTLYVPDPAHRISPCNFSTDSKNFQAMKKLSCGAIKNQIYLVINLSELYPCSNETIAVAPWAVKPLENCPSSGYIFYNTEVVFDRNGAVIARYRKQNLFMEDEFTTGPLEDETAIFESDFNVRFTLQVCFDIIYKHPGYSNVLKYGINDVLMSTAWVNYLPFFMAHTIQFGWSRGLGINLLVSGYHKPEKFKLGSGIFREYMREAPTYSFDENSGNVLIVSNITTKAASSRNTNLKVGGMNKFQNEEGVATYSYGLRDLEMPKSIKKNRINRFMHENLKKYSKVLLQQTKHGEHREIRACNNEFCCNLTYQYLGNLTYMFVVLNGQTTAPFDAYSVGVKTCGIVWCKSPNFRTCALIERTPPIQDAFGPFKISFSVRALKSVFASGNYRNLSLIDNKLVSFQKKQNVYTLSSLKPVENILQVVMIKRCYGNDGELS